MTCLRNIPIYFITMTTNSKLAVISSPAAKIPSVREGVIDVVVPMELIPPFTELPFDVFANNVRHHLPLGRYANLNMFRNFGRPLWS